MEGLAPFLFFIALIIINVIAGSAKRKKRQQQQQQQMPEQAQEVPQAQEQSAPVESTEPKQTRPLDYMMSKPKGSENPDKVSYKEPVQTIVINSPSNYQEISVDKQDLSWQANDKYQTYLERARLKQDEQQDNPDVIRNSEISDKNKKLAISIEKQQIMQAITYAQVLEQPKSLAYLKRFGIKRVVHKD